MVKGRVLARRGNRDDAHGHGTGHRNGPEPISQHAPPAAAIATAHDLGR